MVSGVHGFHVPAKVSTGESARLLATRKSRIEGCEALAISCAELSVMPMPKAMFDCPEQIQTSPTSTLWNVSSCGPEIFRS